MAEFDRLAPTYDDDFTHSPTAAHLRARVHARLLARLKAGDHVLELGSGTGEDAAFLAAHGIRVTATDASPAMRDVARRKTAHLRGVDVLPLDMNALPAHDFIGPYDAVLANFGALNCVEDRGALAAWLAPRVRPGGGVLLAVMGRWCLWEIGWHLLHAQPRRAFRRLKGRARFGDLWIAYPTPRQLTAEFAPAFQRNRLEALGLFLPPSEVFAAVEKRPRLWRALAALETRFAPHALAAPLADHYWMELVRPATAAS